MALPGIRHLFGCYMLVILLLSIMSTDESNKPLSRTLNEGAEPTGNGDVTGLSWRYKWLAL